MVPKKFSIDFDPVMTVRFCYDSRDEDSENEDPKVISPGREFIEDIECRLQQDIVSTVLQQSKLLFKSVIFLL